MVKNNNGVDDEVDNANAKEVMTLTYEKEGDHFKMEFNGTKVKCEDGENEKIKTIDHQVRILFLALEQLNKLRKKEMRKLLMLEELAR